MYENLPGGEILDDGLRSMSQGHVDENSLLENALENLGNYGLKCSSLGASDAGSPRSPRNH